MYFKIFTFLILATMVACTEKSGEPPLSQIKDKKAREVLSQAIERSGGWENWTAASWVFYKKRTVLYDSLGQVESDRTQLHKYQLKPAFTASISWLQDGDRHEIFFENNLAKKNVNGTTVEKGGKAHENTVQSALYTLFMPFKLLDPGVELSYRGLLTLPNGEEVHTIFADYEGEEDWEYYFDTNTGDFVANLVDHGDYFALIYNEKFTTSGGLRFNAYRTSYRVDSLRNIQYRRGEFFYDEIVLK